MAAMYRDSFHEPGWMRILRALQASFRLGRFFRVEVRVFYLAVVITPLILLRGAEGLAVLALQADYDAEGEQRRDDLSELWAQEAPPYVPLWVKSNG